MQRKMLLNLEKCVEIACLVSPHDRWPAQTWLRFGDPCLDVGNLGERVRSHEEHGLLWVAAWRPRVRTLGGTVAEMPDRNAGRALNTAMHQGPPRDVVQATGWALVHAISAESLISSAWRPSQVEVPLAAHQRGMRRTSWLGGCCGHTPPCFR